MLTYLSDIIAYSCYFPSDSPDDDMRKVIDSQYKLGQVAIEEIEFPPSDRDDVESILWGLQCVWKSEKHWKEAKEIIEGYLPAGVNPSLGRPGDRLVEGDGIREPETGVKL